MERLKSGVDVRFHQSVSELALVPKGAVLIYDRKLSRYPAAAKLLKRFPKKLAVEAGEKLKDIKSFPSLVDRFHRLAADLPGRELTVYALGGGSVGDFSGLLASIYRRGVGLVHIPTTWLAAIDSAHGGKTGLNIGHAKNQLGSFYQANQIHIIREILQYQDKTNEMDARAELLKIAIVDGRPWAKRLLNLKESIDLWNWLPDAIWSKYRIVAKDMYETAGIRTQLNLGHTLAHALELELGLSHGAAVGFGLQFALEYSKQKKLLPSSSDLLLRVNRHLPLRKPRKINAQRLRHALAQDKKRNEKAKVRFVFVESVGKLRIQQVLISDIISEARRQNWSQ